MAERPIVAIGRRGQLARCLAELAPTRGVPIAVVGRPELDVENGEGIDRILDGLEPSVIINAAAYTAVDKAETEPGRAFAVNCGGAALLADAAARHGVPFVHISTDFIFDGAKTMSYREGDVPAPLNIYGSSKLAGEAAVLRVNPRATVIRTSWVYSPHGTNFVRTMLRLFLTQPVVRVVDDQRGTPTSAVDLAKAILVIAERLLGRQEDAGIYHVAGQGETTWYGLAAAILEGLGRRGGPLPTLQPIKTADYPTPARRPRNSCLDSSKAERVFGVRLPPWRSSLEECLDQIGEMPRELQAC